MKKHERLVANIGLRLPFSMVNTVTSLVESAKYPTEAEAFRVMIGRGLQIEELLAIKNDPQRNKEFEAKMKNILREGDLEKELETYTEDELRSIRFLADNILNKKVHQSILHVKEHSKHA